LLRQKEEIGFVHLFHIQNNDNVSLEEKIKNEESRNGFLFPNPIIKLLFRIAEF
jgi:hypothetical protein